jgi:uncharacterized protein YuzB (UPF0349 family)
VKISELIEKLQEYLRKHGDLVVSTATCEAYCGYTQTNGIEVVNGNLVIE